MRPSAVYSRTRFGYRPDPGKSQGNRVACERLTAAFADVGTGGVFHGCLIRRPGECLQGAVIAVSVRAVSVR